MGIPKNQSNESVKEGPLIFLRHGSGRRFDQWISGPRYFLSPSMDWLHCTIKKPPMAEVFLFDLEDQSWLGVFRVKGDWERFKRFKIEGFIFIKRRFRNSDQGGGNQ